MSEINLVTYPDHDHNSDYKVCLVADTPSAIELIDVLEKLKGRVSISCITHDTTDFDWIATTVNSANFVFINKCSQSTPMYIGWILGRPNVWHNLKSAEIINGKYSSSILTAYIKHLDKED